MLNQLSEFVFIDLEKAYEKVPRKSCEGSQRREEFGLLIYRVIRNVYHRAKTCVITYGANVEIFPIIIGFT